MVTVYLPAGVAELVVTVIVAEAAPPVMETVLGLKLAVAPLGSTLVTVRLTVPVKPPLGVIVTV
jgi:hypothetical protein